MSKKKSKGRSSRTYENKLKQLRKWYDRRLKNREEKPNLINSNTKKPIQRKELKPFEYYVDKLKKPTNQGAIL